MMKDKKSAWQTPKLAVLDVERTLTGPLVFDNEATFGGVDQNLGGPASWS